MANWLEEMVEQPAFQNSRNFEYQFRRNMLVNKAYDTAEEFAFKECGGVEPSSEDVEAYRKYTDLHQQVYFWTMDMLWKQAYPDCPLIPED